MMRICITLIALFIITISNSWSVSAKEWTTFTTTHVIDFSEPFGEIIQAISDYWHVPVAAVAVNPTTPAAKQACLVDFFTACNRLSSMTGLIPNLQDGALHFIQRPPISSWCLWVNHMIDETSIVIQLLSHLAQNYKNWNGVRPLHIPSTDKRIRGLIATLLRQYGWQFRQEVYDDSLIALSIEFVPRLALLDKQAAMLYDTPLTCMTPAGKVKKGSDAGLESSWDMDARGGESKVIKVPHSDGNVWTLKSIAKLCRSRGIRVYIDRRVADNRVVLSAGVWEVKQLLSAVALIQQLELRRIANVWFISAQRVRRRALRSVSPYMSHYSPQVLNAIVHWCQRTRPALVGDLPFKISDFISLARRRFSELTKEQKEYILALLIGPSFEGSDALRTKLLVDLLLIDADVQFMPQLLIAIRIRTSSLQDSKRETYFVVFP